MSFSRRFASGNKVSINGASLYYEMIGVGKHPVLLLPGALGSTKTDFAKQLESFDRNNFTLVGIDLRGYGQSQPPPKTFSVDFLTKDADDATALMDFLGLSTYSILGWSDGANVAAIMAAKFPCRIRKLVIWGGNSYVSPQDLDIFQKVRDISQWSERMTKPMIDVYGEEVFEQLWHAWVDIFLKMPKDLDGNIDLYKNDLEKITCKTLIIHGEKDAMVPKFHPLYLQKHIKNSRLVCWPDGKHNLHIKYDERFKELVEPFLLNDGIHSQL